MPAGSTWRQPQPTHTRGRPAAQRQPFNGAMDHSFRTSVSTTRSDHSDSTTEVENLLAHTGRHGARNSNVHAFPGAAMQQLPQRVSTAQAAPIRGEQLHSRVKPS